MCKHRLRTRDSLRSSSNLLFQQSSLNRLSGVKSGISCACMCTCMCRYTCKYAHIHSCTNKHSHITWSGSHSIYLNTHSLTARQCLNLFPLGVTKHLSKGPNRSGHILPVYIHTHTLHLQKSWNPEWFESLPFVGKIHQPFPYEYLFRESFMFRLAPFL